MTERAVRRPPRLIQARRLAGAERTLPSRSNVWSIELQRFGGALLSSLVPGLGQALNRRWRMAAWFALPIAIALVIAGAALLATSPPILVARLIEPRALQGLLVLNLLVLAWRLGAVAHAFVDPRHGRPSRLAIVALVGLVVLTTIPHAIARSWGEAAQSAFGRIFETPTGAAGTGDALTSRVNVLIVGIDKTPWRTATLTDSLMVASLDPVGRTVSLVSLPRDLVNVPLGDGSKFGPKLNSLMSFADRHRDQFPKGGLAALQSAVGALLGIPIHYSARIDFTGFIKIVDAVGGVDIVVDHGFTDPLYDGYGLPGKGYTITSGLHHFDGREALAYARSRQANGESDFKRAERQQEIVLAIRDKLLDGGSLIWRVPTVLATLGDFIKTDVPVSLLPTAAAIADEMGKAGVTRVVIKYPLVRPGRNQYGSIQIPDLKKIRSVAAGLFSAPGTPPKPWPTPAAAPSGGPAASTSAGGG